MSGLKICLIGKYPPIEGGVSKNNFWLARWLAEKGHEVHVITNAFEVEEAYRVYLEGDDLEMLQCHFSNKGQGKVKLWTSNPYSSNPFFIPFAKPYVSKLAGMAVQEIDIHGLDLVYSSYFEPYGVAGYLASSLTGVPHVMIHAGSDFYRLMQDKALGSLYRSILKQAACVITSPAGADTMREWGIKEEHLSTAVSWCTPLSHFNPQAPALDVNAFIQRMISFDRPYMDTVLRWAPKELHPEIPTIGLYGKVGANKGSYDLVDALALLSKEGIGFNFLAMSGGKEIERFKDYVLEKGIERHTFFLPFLPHWKVPSFIRACTAVCFLERGFWLPQHTPGIPREIMACGTCLVLSGEIERKHAGRSLLRDGVNVVLIDDPRDAPALANGLRDIIKNPERAKEIGLQGHVVSTEIEDPPDIIVANHEAIFDRALHMHQYTPHPERMR